MAIQPSIRLAGSEHILRFEGVLLTQATAGDQTVNGEVPQGAVADAPTLVKFALADMTDLSDLRRRLPAGVFDNDVPASASRPNNTVVGGPSGSPPSSGVPAGKTWMQNVRVRAQESSTSTASPLIARIDELLPVAELDGLAGLGLSQNTGVPVVGITFYFTADGISALEGEQPVGVPVVIEVEIPHTIER